MDVILQSRFTFVLACCLFATGGSVLGDWLIQCSFGLHNAVIGISIGLGTAWLIERYHVAQ